MNVDRVKIKIPKQSSGFFMLELHNFYLKI